MGRKPLSAAILAMTALAAPAWASVLPGDTFSVAVTGFNQASGTGIYLAGPVNAIFGQTQTFANEGPDGQTVTVTSSEAIGMTTTTDMVSIFVPTNFVPADVTVDGAVIDFIEFDLGEFNADPNGLDFALPIGSPTFSGSVQYGATSTLALTPDVALSNGDRSLAMGEALSTSSASGLSQFAIKRFNFSVTYTNPVTPSVPEPASWAMMIAGFGVVGYAMRRAVRRSEARFDDRIRRITAGEIA